MKKIFNIIFHALEWLAMISLVVMTGVVFFDVILRYIFNQGMPWTQEIATLLLVWFSLIGMAIGVGEKIHISIEMFTMKWSKKVIGILETIDHLLIAGIGVMMLVYGLQIMNVTKNSTMPATKMPSAVLYIILPLAGVLVFLNALIVAAKKDKQLIGGAGKEDEHA
jgi:TRAP-type C4-dicarboxylate transport system permease small subunit